MPPLIIFCFYVKKCLRIDYAQSFNATSRATVKNKKTTIMKKCSESIKHFAWWVTIVLYSGQGSCDLSGSRKRTTTYYEIFMRLIPLYNERRDFSSNNKRSRLHAFVEIMTFVYGLMNALAAIWCGHLVTVLAVSKSMQNPNKCNNV